MDSFTVQEGGETRFTPRPSSYKWEALGSTYFGGLDWPLLVLVGF